MRICALAFLFCLSLSMRAQTSGTLLDELTKQPIQNVTIYIDGTTQGTTTNAQGYFELDKLSFPCRLIISHVSYNIKPIQLYRNIDLGTLHLSQRLIKIPEFSILNNNAREKNLRIFKAWFLGVDYWANNAEILNDSILYFSYDSTYFESTDSLPIAKQDSVKTRTFRVKTNGPIWIRLPLLGYKIRVDLINFKVVQNFEKDSKIGSYQGYFHFLPFENMSRRDKRIFTRNRRIAFYNSRMHFGRSLINEELLENGYVVRELPPLMYQTKLTQKDLYKKIIKEERYVILAGLKGRMFSIKYYQKYNNKPYDLIKYFGAESIASQMFVMSDSAIFYPSGNTPNLDIMFSGYISTKKIGSILPETYSPKDKIN